eukprot:SAG25_NODE_315_length_9978_cov_10.651483_5_plen_176_part_00
MRIHVGARVARLRWRRCRIAVPAAAGWCQLPAAIRASEPCQAWLAAAISQQQCWLLQHAVLAAAALLLLAATCCCLLPFLHSCCLLLLTLTHRILGWLHAAASPAAAAEEASWRCVILSSCSFFDCSDFCSLKNACTGQAAGPSIQQPAAGACRGTNSLVNKWRFRKFPTAELAG